MCFAYEYLMATNIRSSKKGHFLCKNLIFIVWDDINKQSQFNVFSKPAYLVGSGVMSKSSLTINTDRHFC